MLGKITGPSFDRTSAISALAVLLFICVYQSVALMVKAEYWLSLVFIVGGAVLASSITGSRMVRQQQAIRALSVSLVWLALILSIWVRLEASLDWFYLCSFSAYLLVTPKWANCINGAGIAGLFIILNSHIELTVVVIQLLPLLVAMGLANIVCLQIGYLKKELENSHTIDSLTGCANRACLKHEMLKASGFLKRYQVRTSAVALKVNDMQTQIETLGHNKFDALLVELTQVWRSRLRNTDTLCRYSDDVFIVILPSTNSTNADLLAQDLLKASDAYEFSAGEHVSVSFRVIEHDGSDSWETWCNKLVNHN